MKRENETLANFRSLSESRLRLAAEESRKIEEAVAEHDKFIKNYDILKATRARKESTHTKLMEAARDDALAKVIKAVYITALEADTLTDNGIILAEDMVDKWIKENGGASTILSKVAENTYLLSRITQIVEDAAEKEVAEVEKSEDDDIDDTTSKDLQIAQLNAKDANIKAQIADLKAAKKEEEEEAKSDDTKEDSKEEDKSEDNKEVSKDDEEVDLDLDDEESDTKEDKPEEKESKKDDEEVDLDLDDEESDTKEDKSEEKEPKEEEPKEDKKEDSKEEDKSEDKEDKKEDKKEPATGSTDESTGDDEEVDIELDDEESDTKKDDSKEDKKDEQDISDEADEDVLSAVDDDDEYSDDNDIELDDNDVDDDGKSDKAEEAEEVDITVDGNTDNKGEIFDNLDKEEDIQKAADLIRQRVANAEENFIRNNAEDKKKVDELINRISTNVKAVEDLNDKNNTEKEIKQESIRMDKRRIDNIRDNRPLTIFEKMTRNLISSIVKNEAVLESTYTTDEGKLDMAAVVESAKVMYAFLETINTLQLANVDNEYIKNILNEMH